MKKYTLILLITSCLFYSAKAQKAKPSAPSTVLFNDNWQFAKDADITIAGAQFNKNATGWQNVSLPHTANIEPVIKVKEQWQGICLYRKFFVLNKDDKGKHITIRFDGVMGEADVYMNGQHLLNHKGGFLPFEVNIPDNAVSAKENCLMVRLNNKDNAEIPPGKPMKDLDFNFYGGIYRNAWLIKKRPIYITDAVTANKTNGGGIVAHYDSLTNETAKLHLKIDLQNDYGASKNIKVKTILYSPAGKIAGSSISTVKDFKSGEHTITQNLNVREPYLWSPVHPKLYRLVVTVENNGTLIDSASITTGIREIAFKADGFYLNGSKYILRGTNRHQEYPYIGYALSDNAQYRDAYKIKQAGYDFVRCSHYPPSPAFLNACDELGIFVMDSTPGWQFFGNEVFQRNSLQNITDMVHRDRNHPSIILWESSLNETQMQRGYMEKANAIVHQELPYADTYTCGWMDAVYDVFIPARQHAKAPNYWKKYNKNKPIFIAEYGDWEYYAQNAGFNQTAYEGLTAEEKTSRQLRTDGEKRMLQQANNFQEAHNDNLNGKITGDASWLMFDYKRGYAADIESSGIMDIYRLPKYVYYFFQSQRDAEASKPMAFIASNWDKLTGKTLTVYSNCEQVELFLNSKSLGKQMPDTGKMNNNLNHPPFTFNLAYQPGTLTAKGFIKGQEAVSAERKTPENASKIVLTIDHSGKALKAGYNDAVFVYASVVDKNGTVIPDATNSIHLTIEGKAEVTGDQTVKAEAGVASFLVKAGSQKGTIKLTAISAGLTPGVLADEMK